MNKENIQQELLRVVKEAREAKGLSRRKLADITGISPASYNDYESGASPFPFDRLLKVAEVLELDIFNFGKTVEVEQTTIQLVPLDGKQVEGYFHATVEGYKQIQERMDKTEIENKKILEEINELKKNQSKSQEIDELKQMLRELLDKKAGEA